MADGASQHMNRAIFRGESVLTQFVQLSTDNQQENAMDPMTIAGAVVAVIAPYLAESGKGAAKKVGEAAVDHVGALLSAIRRKFADEKDEYAQQTLTRLEDQPQVEGRLRSLAELLVEKVQEDEVFAQELASLVERAQRNAETMQFLTQIYGGQVKDIFNIGSVKTLNIGKRDDG